MEVRSLSKKVYSRLNQNTDTNMVETFVDPATFLVILQIVTAVIEAIRKCKSEDEIETTFKNPTLLDRVILKNAIRKELGFWKNLSEGKKYLNAILEEAKEDSSIKEVKSLIKK